MKHHLPPLDSLKVFEAAARHLSFSLAADELCISKGAVSYQIRKLETHIQSPLFNRSIRQVYLTDSGQSLFKTIQNQFAELDKTLSQINSDRNSQDITIAATTYVAARWLSPRIARFNQQHPDISVVFHHSVNSLNFKLRDVDLAIRWEAHSEMRKTKQHLHLAMPLFPVCSPKLLERINVKTEKNPLKATALNSSLLGNIPLLSEDRAVDHWQIWYDSTYSSISPLSNPAADSQLINQPLTNPRHVISDANVRVQAAIDGQGLIMADKLMQNELDNGLLIPLFKQQLTGYGYTLMLSPMQNNNTNAQLLYEWLSRH